MLRLLGAIEAGPDRCALAPVPPGHARRLVAVLATNHRRAVSTAALAEVLWSGDPPATATNALQGAVSKIRRLLEPDLEPRRPSSFLHTDGDGYRLDLPDGAIDLDRFRRHLDRAREAGDPEATLTALRDALDDWRPPPLAELCDEPWALTSVAELRRLRDDATRLHGATLLELDRTAEAVAVLEPALGSNPYDEQVAALLMRAHYRAGRQQAALDVLRVLRQRLRDDLGLDPTPELVALERQILHHDVDGASSLSSSTASVAGPTGGSDRRTPLFGRSADLDAVTASLGRHRIVTLHGPGGVGKTRLATELVQRWPGPTAWIDFDGLDDGGDVDAHVVETLELDGDPLTDPIRTTAIALGTAALLVLDNAEHLVDAIAAVALRAADVPTGPRVLVTSRRALGLDAEHVHTLAPLTLPDVAADLEVNPSVQLVLERSGTKLDDHDPAELAALCRELDGLPLALRLAANHLRTLGAAEVRAGWSSLRTESGPADLDRRHRSLDVVVESSLASVSALAADVLALLAAAAGPLPLDAVGGVFADDADPIQTRRAVAELVTSSLVALERVAGRSTYRVPGAVRTHLADRDGPSRQAAIARHRTWIERLTVQALGGRHDDLTDDELHRETSLVLDRLEADPSSRATHLTLLTTAGTHWYGIGRVADARVRLRRALDDRAGLEPLQWAPACALLGLISFAEGEFADLARYTDEALEVLEPLGAPGLTLVRAGNAVGHGRLAEAHRSIVAVLASDELTTRERTAHLEVAATTAWQLGRFRTARTHFEQQAEVGRAASVDALVASALRGQAATAALDGEHAAAADLERRARETDPDPERSRLPQRSTRALVRWCAGSRRPAADDAVTVLQQAATHFDAFRVSTVLPIVVEELAAADARLAASLVGWFDGVRQATGFLPPAHVVDDLARLDAELTGALGASVATDARVAGAEAGLGLLAARVAEARPSGADDGD